MWTEVVGRTCIPVRDRLLYIYGICMTVSCGPGLHVHVDCIYVFIPGHVYTFACILYCTCKLPGVYGCTCKLLCSKCKCYRHDRYVHVVQCVNAICTNLNAEQERPLGQRKTPPANTCNKLHNSTSKLMLNITSKYIFTEYRSSITQYLNDLGFYLSKSLSQIYWFHYHDYGFPLYGFQFMFNSNLWPN